MDTEKRNSKYYVVGGPVQPDRPCYVIRDADARLYSRLSDGEYCHVLASRHSGKTSLMARTANRLREDGVQVAILDLAQVGGRDDSTDVGRWYYSIAYRIVRELRIRSEMQEWWQERSGLSNLQRLREFFLEVVLAGTEGPVVIFIDRIEAATGKGFKREIFGAIRACFDARATEPDFQRLSFAILGTATAKAALPGGRDSPIDIAVEIKLRDFRWNELKQLASGLGCDPETSAQLSERVWHWSGGQPYLSQKIFRGLARKTGSKLTDQVVDDLVETLFLSRNAIHEEAHLSQIGRQVLGEAAGRTLRLSTYGRLRKGAAVEVDRSSSPHRALLDSGVVVEDTSRMFAVRNLIYAQVFTARWANRNLPFEWKGPAISAALVALLVAIPFWYMQILPNPYVDTLTQPDQDYATAIEAHRGLSFFPGFGSMADELLTSYLAGQSRLVTDLLAAERIDDRLAEIPGNEETAAELMAEFWDRKANRATFAGDRDAALLYRLQALKRPTADRKKLVSELLGDDYRRLVGTIRPIAPLSSIQLEQESGLLTALDIRHDVEQWRIENGAPSLVQRLELVAEVLVPVQRRLLHRGEGAGRDLRLVVVVDHARAADIVVTLRAPSGKQVALQLIDEAAVAGRIGEYRFQSRTVPELAALLEENVTGTWTAFFTDHRESVVGSLVDWSVVIDDIAAEYPQGTGAELIVLPDPQATRRAGSTLAPGGRRAMTWPAEQQVPGNILVWDLTRRSVLARIPRPAGFSSARFVLGHGAVLVSSASGIDLWDTLRGDLVGHLPVEVAPGTDLTLSENGRFLVVDTRQNETDNVLTLWDLQEFKEVGHLVTGELMDLVATDPRGQYIAVSDGDRLVRLWAVREGTLVAEIELASQPIALQFDSTGAWLVTQDAAYTLQLWSSGGQPTPMMTRSANSVWQVAFDPAGHAMMLGSVSHGFEVIDLAQGTRIGMPFRHGTPVAEHGNKERVELSSSLGLAVTYDGEAAIRIWEAPQLNPAPDDAAASLARSSGTVTAISQDGQQLAFGTTNGDIRITPLDLPTLFVAAGDVEPGLIGHMSPVTSVVFDSSGRLLGTGSLDGRVRVWETVTGAPRGFFAGHGDGAVHDMIFSEDGLYLVSASRSTVMVTHAGTGEVLAQLRIQGENPQLALGSDGEMVYVAGDRDGVTSWQWRDGEIRMFTGFEQGVQKLAVTPGGNLMVTVGEERLITLWDVAEEGHRRQAQVRIPGAVDALWFTPDNRSVVVQSGSWLYKLSAGSAGLSASVTRLLPDVPQAVKFMVAENQLLLVTHPYSARPQIQRIDLAESWAEPVDQSADELTPILEERLQLTLNAWGEPQVLRSF